MDTIVDDAVASLAAHLRRERDARGWSLADLAARSGVSRAAISKIERQEMSPTATILVRLAGAFDLTLAGLLLRAEGAGDRLSRASTQATWRDPESGYIRRQVFSRPDHPVELVEVALPPGARIPFPAASYARIRQAVWVLEGSLSIEEAGERHALETGDCLGFGPPSNVVLANETTLPCRYLVALARS